jgi:hypothetical protein
MKFVQWHDVYRYTDDLVRIPGPYKANAYGRRGFILTEE